MKVTISLAEPLLKAVDNYVRDHPETSRSGVCAKALLDWVKARQDEEITHYYETMSDEERAEDESWHKITAESARKTWLSEP